MTAHRSAIAGAATFVVVLGVGLAGFRWGYATFQGRDAIAGLATGLAVAACGFAVWWRAPANRIGPLLVLCALAWFPSDWRSYDEQVLVLGRWLTLVYASLMAHVLMTYPLGRTTDRGTRAAIVLGYLAAALPATAGSAVLVLLLTCRFAWVTRRHPLGTRENELKAVAGMGAAFGAVLMLTTFVPFVTLDSHSVDLRVALQATLVTTAAVVTASILRARSRSSVADLVVEMDDSRGGGLAFELGMLLGDATLQVGYSWSGGDSFVDPDGRALALPTGNDRAATLIEREGQQVAVLIHRADLTADSVLQDAVARTADIAAANARLQAELRAQMAELEASRRRLVAAGADERIGLERRLRDGPERRLVALTDVLRDVVGPATPSAIAVPLARTLEQLTSAREELDELADGLHPRILDRLGLAGAIGDLARRCPVPVDVQVHPALDLGDPGAATAYFVTSEALANVAKHSGAARCWVSLALVSNGSILTIGDDGRGGATLTGGTGLLGLSDRVQAVGGSLSISSPAGHGTLLAATIPSGGEEVVQG